MTFTTFNTIMVIGNYIIQIDIFTAYKKGIPDTFFINVGKYGEKKQFLNEQSLFSEKF